MTAREAYQSITSRNIRRRNEAYEEGWRLPECHGETVIMRNRKTGEAHTGYRKWSKTADDWGKRVSFCS